MKNLLLYSPTIVTGVIVYCTLVGICFNNDWLRSKINNMEKKSLKHRDINTIYSKRSNFAFYSVCFLSVIIICDTEGSFLYHRRLFCNVSVM